MNYLNNGAVLPSGLLGHNASAKAAGFNKTYRNFPLRMGIVIESYGVKDDKNYSKLTNEYDVLIFEQLEDRGASAVIYRNCMTSDGMGSIADFFEKSLRKRKRKGKKDNTKDQNGAVVLVLCLDGVSEKGIIISCLSHPDRKTTLSGDSPHLEGEYNGVNIKVLDDGSTSLTFKGATDNDGKLLDKEQGDTVIGIEKDGSFQVKHKTITQRLDKKGKASLAADDDISNTTKKNFNVTATENVVIKATKNFSVEMTDLIAKASGSATLECQKLLIKAESDIMIKGSEFKVEAEAMAKIKATSITLDGLVNLGGDGGQPVLLLGTMFMGIGNLGAPVMSSAIAGFALKVNAQ